MPIGLIEDVEEIARDWQTLFRRDAAAIPFQSPAWLEPWAESFAHEKRVLVCFGTGGRAVAIVPFFRHEGRLLLWGAGTTDWLDGVFAPDFDRAELTAGIAALGEPVDLFNLSPDSPLLRMPAPSGWEDRAESGEGVPALDLPARLPANMASNLGYYRRRAERAGIGPPRRAGPAGFEALVELHARRWARRGETGVLADPLVLSWHRRALPRLEGEGLLRFFVLERAGEIVAALYALKGREAAYYYLGGFDPQFAELGLGTILIGHAIAEAEREGARRFDFLRGREGYKYRWGATDRPSAARRLTPGGRTR